jgi:predicted ArsR family transcriptional regulator
MVMMKTTPIELLLGSTRGQILSLLCGAPGAVTTLTRELGLTANAVRVQLAALERDGLVRRTSVRQGVGKPAYHYEATPGGRGLLSRAYQPALASLLGALAGRLTPGELEATLRETGRRLGAPHRPAQGDAASRIQVAVLALGELGSVARADREGAEGCYVISGACCPLSDLVAEHPGVCTMVESMLASIIGAPVREHCLRGPTPRCRFAVAQAADAG